MSTSVRTSMMAATIWTAIPIVAHAQSVTAFDGTYAGVSEQNSGGRGRCAAANPVPGTLRIANGSAVFGT
jgi:hypothetical protein